MSGWQPIATAPKDATEVLVAELHWPHQPIVNVCWYDASMERWWVNAQGDQEMNPDYWMPIPKLPEAP